jgi:hypothetical protein
VITRTPGDLKRGVWVKCPTRGLKERGVGKRSVPTRGLKENITDHDVPMEMCVDPLPLHKRGVWVKCPHV